LGFGFGSPFPHFYNLSPVLRSPRENCLLLPKIEICNHNAGDTKCRIWFPLIATMYYSPHGIASRILHGAASICPFRSEWSTRKNINHFKECYPTLYIGISNKCFQLHKNIHYTVLYFDINVQDSYLIILFIVGIILL